MADRGGAPPAGRLSPHPLPDTPALATICAVVTSARGRDTATLVAGLCAGIAEHLGFERVVIARYRAHDDAVEAVGAHGVSLQEIGLVRASAGAWPLLRQARDTGALVVADAAATEAGVPVDVAHAYGLGAAVVVPLVCGERCVGFLAADRAGSAFELDAPERDVLTTLGTVLGTILERATAHDELIEADRLKSDFIPFAAHELRTPVTAVYGIAATLHGRDGVLEDEQRRALLEVLYEQGQRLYRLVEQLLDLSRLETSSIRIRPALLAVRERTETIVRGLAGPGAQEIELLITPVLRAKADPDAFDRIVSNLIVNALRYGRQPIIVSALVRDRHFRLTVEDRGGGVPDELAPHLFERFVRGDRSGPAGAGLGLSIAQAYARAHGGEVIYENAVPHGARFQLVLPLASTAGLGP